MPTINLLPDGLKTSGHVKPADDSASRRGSKRRKRANASSARIEQRNMDREISIGLLDAVRTLVAQRAVNLASRDVNDCLQHIREIKAQKVEYLVAAITEVSQVVRELYTTAAVDVELDLTKAEAKLKKLEDEQQALERELLLASSPASPTK